MSNVIFNTEEGNMKGIETYHYNFVIVVENEPVSYFELVKITDNNNYTDFKINIEDGIVPKIDFDVFEEVTIGLFDSISNSNDFDASNNITYTVQKREVV
jgi:hypothetical protein